MKVIVLGIFAAIIVLFSGMFETNSSASEIQKAKTIRYSALSQDSRQQVECLAQNIYYEARAETPQGQLAVALVTLNRSQSSLYPKNICHVVREKIGNTCQFTWWCDAELRAKATNYRYNERERAIFEESRKMALYAFINYAEINDVTNGAVFYHANYVNPRWKYQKTARIGNHIFYKQ